MENQGKENQTAITVTPKLFASLKQLSESKFSTIDISDMGQYNELKDLVGKGLLEKNGLQFKLTEEGLKLIKDVESYLDETETEMGEEGVSTDEMSCYKDEQDKKKEGMIPVSYMSHNLKEDTIEKTTEYFEVANDGIPMIQVTESAYSSLLDRQPNQHWRPFVGEGGRKLIREHKLDRVYIQNEKTGRTYLYIVPKK